MAKSQCDGLKGLKLEDERIMFLHDWEGEVDLGTSLTNAVALLTDTPQERVADELVLGIDMDALNRLFKPRPEGPPRDGGQFKFRVGGCAITVQSDGFVIVERESG